jgi:hypothetical protein
MQVKPMDVKSDPDVIRHQSMRKLALTWLAQTRSSQQKLVELINKYWQAQGVQGFKCEHTLLSRMLHPSEPYLAMAGRAKAMKIQEAILVICSGPTTPSVIETAPEPDEVWASDEEHAFVAHRARLRSLRNREGLRPFQAVALMGELIANALGMDDSLPSNAVGETFRQRAAENALMSLAVIVDEEDVTRSLAHRMASEDALDMERALQIQDAQVARVRKVMSSVKEPTVGMMAYAGIVLFHSGKRDTGFGLLIEAVRRSYDIGLRHDPNWETLIEFLDRLEGQKAVDADKFLEQAVALFDQTLSDPEREKHRQLMVRAFAMVEAPHVSKAIHACCPRMAAKLYPASGGAPKGGAGAGAANVVVILLLALGSLVSGASVWNHVWNGPDEVMVAGAGNNYAGGETRGREAKGGQGNPPPPPAKDQQT